MRKVIRVFVLVLLLAAAYTACQRASEEQRTDIGATDSVLVVYKSLNDSVMMAWNEVEANEALKLSDMKRLLEEISYTPVYNKGRYDSLWNTLQELYAIRLEADVMTSEQIDRYDSAITYLQREVIDFAYTHPDFEQYPLMGKLTDSIRAADDRVLFLRSRYDNYVREYNDFLKGNQGRLIEPADTTLPLRERPMFQLMD